MQDGMSLLNQSSLPSYAYANFSSKSISISLILVIYILNSALKDSSSC